MKKIVILGGGASGFFIASNLEKSKKYSVTIVEKSKSVMQKVRISGGGRCNVTHACYEPAQLVKFYPRGERELQSVFHRFNPKDTIQWFEKNNVPLKIESDNRIFPKSNSSSSIVECLYDKSIQNGTLIKTEFPINSIEKKENQFIVHSKNESLSADILLVCSGSAPKIWDCLQELGHTIINPVPSLFSFNIQDKLLHDLLGTSFQNAEISIIGMKKYKEKGDLLITHWGLSGPTILRISAWKARELAELDYNFEIKVNFLGISYEQALQEFIEFKNNNGNKKIEKNKPFSITNRFWNRILDNHNINSSKNYAELTKKELTAIVNTLTQSVFNVEGKSINKEEFVTCGGVKLSEVNFKTMESKKHKNLYFAGEVLNIDGITGGFNFQACWSESYIISEELKSI
ncbi:MAG: NAD(P)/FAD-dependent oxidoreductase [Flavobacteriales bacterium]|nr:NAD(P)/FAD-dependent oxidoreductase [Flavobacteriales bacterium]